MTRTLTTSFGLLLVATSLLYDQSGVVRGSQLAMAWGGDTGKTTTTQRCDYQKDTLV